MKLITKIIGAIALVTILTTCGEHRTVYYGPHPNQKVLFYTVDPQAPTVVFIHGGSWSSGSPDNIPEVAEIINNAGYNSVLVGYRLLPDYRAGEQVEDVTTAIGLVTGPLVVSGGSAGGYHALVGGTATALRGTDVRCIINFAGPANLVDTTHPLKLELYKQFAGNYLKEFSPYYLADTWTGLKDGVKFYNIISQHDQIVDPQELVSLDTKLQALGFSRRLSLLDDLRGHEVPTTFVASKIVEATKDCFK